MDAKKDINQLIKMHQNTSYGIIIMWLWISLRVWGSWGLLVDIT